jgi:esterase/lipase superfamily enzyme
MIQYFATNRALDKLAQVVSDRETRLKLSKGGYYFVDMDKYMHYYLATTDSAKMPKGAVMTNSKHEIFDSFLADKLIGRIVVCVHGFNVELFEAYTWFRVLTDTMKHVPEFGKRIVTSRAELKAKPKGTPAGSLTAFIGFSWPSNGNVFSYASDQREAVGTAPAFASLLAHLKTTGKSVNLIGHSMGNYLACHAFAALINEVVVPAYAVEKPEIQALLKRAKLKPDSENIERTAYFVDSYVMIAPDVERRHVTKCEVAALDDSDAIDTDYVGPFYSGLQHLVGKKVNVYSRFDSALNVSDLEKRPREAVLAAGDALSRWSFGLLEFLERNPDQRWEKRLGSSPAPINAAPGFVSVNSTEIAGRKIDHSDHIDVIPLAQRIAEELGI